MKKFIYRGDLYLNIMQIIISGVMIACSIIGLVTNIVINPSFLGAAVWTIFILGSYIMLRIVYKEFKEEK